MEKHPLVSVIMLVMLLLCTSCSITNTANQQGSDPAWQVDHSEQPPDADEPEVKVILENEEWSDIWIENANQSEKMRILFVGDSIAEGYFSRVSGKLSQDYYLGYYVTSKFVSNPDFQTELITILDRYDFGIIHINNGLHGMDYTIEDYQKGLEELSEILEDHAPQALKIWCMTTPMRLEEDLDFLAPLNSEIIRRNLTSLEVWEPHDVLIFDLYQEMVGHPEYYRDDGIHFNIEGRAAQAEAIAAFIQSLR
jgi:lysophospholipase L1-like esterase